MKGEKDQTSDTSVAGGEDQAVLPPPRRTLPPRRTARRIPPKPRNLTSQRRPRPKREPRVRPTRTREPRTRPQAGARPTVGRRTPVANRRTVSRYPPQGGDGEAATVSDPPPTARRTMPRFPPRSDPPSQESPRSDKSAPVEQVIDTSLEAPPTISGVVTNTNQPEPSEPSESTSQQDAGLPPKRPNTRTSQGTLKRPNTLQTAPNTPPENENIPVARTRVRKRPPGSRYPVSRDGAGRTSPDAGRTSPDAGRTSSAARRTSPAARRTSPASGRKSPATGRTPGRTPGRTSGRTSPAVRRTSPAARRTSPAARRTSPTARRTSPTARRTSPTARRTSPSVRRTSPSVRRTSPSVRRTSPAARRTSPAARRISPATQPGDQENQPHLHSELQSEPPSEQPSKQPSEQPEQPSGPSEQPSEHPTEQHPAEHIAEQRPAEQHSEAHTEQHPAEHTAEQRPAEQHPESHTEIHPELHAQQHPELHAQQHPELHAQQHPEHHPEQHPEHQHSEPPLEELRPMPATGSKTHQPQLETDLPVLEPVTKIQEEKQIEVRLADDLPELEVRPPNNEDAAEGSIVDHVPKMHEQIVTEVNVDMEREEQQQEEPVEVQQEPVEVQQEQQQLEKEEQENQLKEETDEGEIFSFVDTDPKLLESEVHPIVREKVAALLGYTPGAPEDQVTAETLLTYVILLLQSRQGKVTAIKDLRVFLESETTAFVTWLWEFVGSFLIEKYNNFDNGDINGDARDTLHWETLDEQTIEQELKPVIRERLGASLARIAPQHIGEGDIDDNIVQYIMLLLANRHTKKEIARQLEPFFDSEAAPFTNWLWGELKPFGEAKKKSDVQNSQTSLENDSVWELHTELIEIEEKKHAYEEIASPLPSGDDLTLFEGSCFCEAIKFTTSTPPIGAVICHCTVCQRLHGAPMQWAVLFKKQDFRFISGEEHLRFFNVGKEIGQHRILPCRVSCAVCFGRIGDEGRNNFFTFPSLFGFTKRNLPDSFKPTAHLFYGSHSVEVNDGLPKYLGKRGSDVWQPEKDKKSEVEQDVQVGSDVEQVIRKEHGGEEIGDDVFGGV